jgi:non-ribosomal peptide synthetase component F
MDASSWQSQGARRSRRFDRQEWSARLCRYLRRGQVTDFSLNVTFFNRPPIHPQLKDIIGDFTSTLLLEVHGAGDTFEVRARRLQEQLLRDVERHEYSGVRVLRQMHSQRASAIAAAAPIVFTSGLSIRSVDDSPTFSIGDVIYGISQTPQVWLDHQTFDRSGRLFTS